MTFPLPRQKIYKLHYLDFITDVIKGDINTILIDFIMSCSQNIVRRGPYVSCLLFYAYN